MTATSDTSRETNSSSRPLQIVSWDEKTPEWYQRNLDHYIAKSNFNFGATTGDRKDIRILYQVYNNEFPLSWFEHFTDPLNAKNPLHKKFPAKIRPLNMLRTNIDLLLGEYPRRPFVYNVENYGESGYNRYMDGMVQKAQETLTQHFIQAALQQAQESGQELTPEQLQQLQQEPPIPENVKAEFQGSYKDIIAIKGQKWLRRIIREQEIKRKLHRMFKDWLIAGECYSYKSIENDRMAYRRISALNLCFDKSEEQIFVEDGEWVVNRDMLTCSEVTDKFYPVLKEQQHKDLETKGYMRSAPAFFDNISKGQDTANRIPVYHVQWKGRKKIGFLSYFDMETFQLVEDVVDENYIVDREKGEQVEWRWVNEVYEGWRIATDIYVSMQPCPYQRNEMNNHSVCKLSYNGRKYSDTHATNISVMEMGLPYQIMHILTGYTLEKTIAKSKGKILLIDLNAIPDNEDWDEEKFFYYGESMGYALLDRNQGGVDKSWNQYQVLDMSLFDQIKQLIDLQAYYKQQWDDIIGINRQRKGQTYASDGSQVNERAAFQSTVITDMIFIGFEEFCERELQGIMDLGKFCTARGAYGIHNQDEYSEAIFEVEPDDFVDEDLGVFVESSTDHLNKLNEMKQFAQAMIQNGHKASSVLEIIDAINVSELKVKLRQIEAIDAQMEQQQQQSEEEAAKAMDARKEKYAEFENLLERQFMEAEYDRKDDIEFTRGTFATYTYQNGDVNANATPDATEVAKLVADRNKFMADYQDKVRKNELKSADLSMKRTKLQHDMQMDRENLKLGQKKAVTDRMKARQKPTTKQ